eukprot:m.33310 g.33310  ORF g.33310 m.33310 type:complete len:481 (+) comp31799_c0_seq6:141-1583(+)
MNVQESADLLVPPGVPDWRVKASHILGKEAAVRRSIHPITNWQAFVHLVKMNVGPGILGLPFAVRHGGLLLGSIGLLVMAVFTISCMALLVHCSHILRGRIGNVGALDYGQVALLAALPFSAKWAKLFQRAIDLLLVFGQFGVCCIFFVFISDNLVQVLKACGVNFGDLSEDNSARIIMAVLLIPLALVNCIRDLDKLAWISTVANLLIVLGLAAIYIFTLGHLNLPANGVYGGPIKDLPLVAPVSQWPIFFGTALYSLGGIGAVLPVENKMKTPKSAMTVLICAMIVANVFFISLGICGYLCFGENVQGSVTLNLPCSKPGDWIYSVVKLYYAAAVAMTYVLQFYIPATIIEASMGWTYLGEAHWTRRRCISSYLFRTLSVAGTCVLAVVIPKLGLFISFIGSVTGSILLFVFPPIVYVLTIANEQHHKAGCRHILMCIFCFTMFLTGLAGFGLGSYTSLDSIFIAFSGNATSTNSVCS